MVSPSQIPQTIDYERASSDRRVVARLIDLAFGAIILSSAGACLAVLIVTPFARKGNETIGAWVLASITLFLFIAYDTIMQRRFGKTIGKMLLELKVVDSKGENLSWRMCLLRTVLLYAMGILVVFLAAVTYSIFGWIFLWSLSRYKIFPHDTASHAFVVRELKGQLLKAAGPSVKPTPLADLEQLRVQSSITQEEFERKKREIKL